MIDKQSVTAHINDINLKAKMYKVIDKAQWVIKNHECKSTDFLDPYELKNAISILNSSDDVRYSIFGGYEGAERNIILIYPYYMDNISCPIKALQISGDFRFKEVSHRDYLGSILGLGIKREKIGDILIHENCCQLIVQDELSDFILLNLKKVSNNKVHVKEINLKDIKAPKQEYKEIVTTVSSLRLDCIISSVFNLSRQDAAKYVLSEKVKVDFETITSGSKNVKEGSLLSVKGKGRAILEEVGSLTKKNKVRIKTKIIL
ncbi:YlmH family RNA-binding protein [Alkalithermobacter paradoxus]|uniref:RNA-binding S4 domain-containing protein n=1 Tax=Alkalithermobacter paradoxus TaxID=29349 RepID=A0A1V4IAE2_9FIRM|nr:hypothetical protein CLOTH_01650 [[Clostridium] thermoalcaliphilum]